MVGMLATFTYQEIRRLRETEDLGVDELAQRFGVSRATVYRSIKTR